MPGRSQTQICCVLSWYSNWTLEQVGKSNWLKYSKIQLSLFQKQTLQRTIQELDQGPTEDDLLFGLNSLGLAPSDGPDMFQCQIKLFSGWWRNWSPQDKQFFISSISN